MDTDVCDNGICTANTARMLNQLTAQRRIDELGRTTWTTLRRAYVNHAMRTIRLELLFVLRNMLVKNWTLQSGLVAILW
jgi:hypothetical protein